MARRPRELVQRLIDEVVNAGDIELIDEFFAPEMAPTARAWLGAFRSSFPDLKMKVVETVVEGDRIVARFTCSATHTGPWRGHAPTGRRFEDIDEVYFFRVRDDRIVEGWGLEDTLSRLEQLGLVRGQ